MKTWAAIAVAAASLIFEVPFAPERADTMLRETSAADQPNAGKRRAREQREDKLRVMKRTDRDAIVWSNEKRPNGTIVLTLDPPLEKTGEGQYLDASMIDTLATLMFMEPMEHVLHEGQPVRAGNGSRNDVTGLYRLADGDVIITVGLSLRLKALLGALGASGLLEEARFATPEDREANIDALREEIQARLGSYTCEEGIALLQGAGVPVARVRTIREAVEDDHFRARGTLKPMYRQGSDEPVERGIVPGFPVKFSGGDLPGLEGGAKLGHHNREVYGRLLELDATAMADLEERGVV